MHKEIITLILFLFLLTIVSCNKKEQIDLENNLYQDQPEILINDKYYSLLFNDPEGWFDTVEDSRFRCDIPVGGIVYRYWIREYSHPQYIGSTEIRFYNKKDDFNYIIAIRPQLKAFYIKWKNKPYKDIDETYVVASTDIGENTKYLETSLPQKIIYEYFPGIRCNIIEKHPKKIDLPFKVIYPNFFLPDLTPKIE